LAVMQLITLSNSDYSSTFDLLLNSHIYIDAISIDSPDGIPDSSFLRRGEVNGSTGLVSKWVECVFPLVRLEGRQRYYWYRMITGVRP